MKNRQNLEMPEGWQIDELTEWSLVRLETVSPQGVAKTDHSAIFLRVWRIGGQLPLLARRANGRKRFALASLPRSGTLEA